MEVRVIVDVKKGTLNKTDEIMGTSGIVFKKVGPQGTGGSYVSSPDKDKDGNIYFQVHQRGASSTIMGYLGYIENHLNMVVTADGKVGVTPSSTAKDYPSTEIYKYTVDEKGKMKIALILHTRIRTMLVTSAARKKADPQ
jgi:hypothetical protein